jgi:hypothetical protein
MENSLSISCFALGYTFLRFELPCKKYDYSESIMMERPSGKITLRDPETLYRYRDAQMVPTESSCHLTVTS